MGRNKEKQPIKPFDIRNANMQALKMINKRLDCHFNFTHNITIDEIREGMKLEYDEVFALIQQAEKRSKEHIELLKQEKKLFKASMLFIDKHKGYYACMRAHYTRKGNMNRPMLKGMDNYEKIYYSKNKITDDLRATSR